MHRPLLPALALALSASTPLAAAGGDAPRGSFDCVVPPSPAPFEVRQPDGTPVSLRLAGTAFAHWLATPDGFAVVERGGWYRYARVDGSGALAATRAVVGRDDPRALGLPASVRPTTPDRELSPPGLSRDEILASAAAPLPAGTRPAGPLAPKSTGTFDNLVLLLRFADHGPGGQDRDLPPAADVGQIMNAVGGDPVLAPSGSVRDHYLENSYGQLSIDSTVVGWLDVPQTELYYANSSYGLTEVTWELITDGLEAADALVDFSEFDADGDGWVDAITFLHSGYGAEWGGTDQYGTYYSDRMWSHKWTIPTWTSDEGVSVGDYNISPGLWGISGSDPGRIGVVAHELGHFFGLPDLYDTDGVGQGLGNWDLMAAGSWDFNSEQLYPSHMTAWSKITMGWLQPTLLLPGAHAAPEVEVNATAFRIDSGYPPGEYVLVENRQNTGFDLVLPQAGLAVYHVDETKGSFGANDPNTDEGYPGQFGWPENGSHYRIAMLQADGDFDMERNFNRGDSGDVYHGFGVDAITGGTTPDLAAYQEGVILANGNELVDIGPAAASMTFVYGNAGAPSIATSALPLAEVGQPYGQSLLASGGTGPLTWTEFRPAAAYAQTDLGASRYQVVGSSMGWQADDGIWPLDLPFSFPYGETEYERVYVSSNGFVDLAPTEAEPWNRSAYLRSATRIAPLWDDLTTASGGDVFVDQAGSDHVTIRWEAARADTLEPAEFSVVLFADGAIELHYGPGNSGLSPTVGLSRSFGVQVDLVATHDGQADLGGASSVRFELQGSALPPGLSLSPGGALTGVPTEEGTWTLQVRATDANRVYDQRTLTLEVLGERKTGPTPTDPKPI